MQESSTRKIYDVQSAFYDVTFGKLVRRRVERAIPHLSAEPSQTVLDLGIGTGMSMGFYPDDVQVVGVDLSPGMLRECREKIISRNISNVSLLRADALHLPFEDDAFDHVFVSHVISVVSDPWKVIREAQRVTRLGGRIVILNHFRSTNRLMSMVEGWLNPLCKLIGWRSDLSLSELISKTNMEVDYRFKMRTIDLWETVVVRNNKSALRPEMREVEEGSADFAGQVVPA